MRIGMLGRMCFVALAALALMPVMSVEASPRPAAPEMKSHPTAQRAQSPAGFVLGLACVAVVGATVAGDVIPQSLRCKSVFAFSRCERMVRILRLMWERGEVGDGTGYSAKLSLALEPRLFSYFKEYAGWAVTMLGVRVHYQRSYGGIFV